MAFLTVSPCVLFGYHHGNRSRRRPQYSKVFIPYLFAESRRGDKFPVTEIPDVGKLDIMVCADAAVPEVARDLASDGAGVILNVLCQGLVIGGPRHRSPLIQLRAAENQCHLVAANRASREGTENSMVCDPERRILELKAL